MPTPFETLVGGDVLGGVLQAYTDIMGFWVYIIILMGILGMIYYKSKSMTMVSIVGLIVGTGLITSGLLPPEGAAVLQTIVILGVVGTIYLVFKKPGG
jgi:hypothetical protein